MITLSVIKADIGGWVGRADYDLGAHVSRGQATDAVATAEYVRERLPGVGQPGRA